MVPAPIPKGCGEQCLSIWPVNNAKWRKDKITVIMGMRNGECCKLWNSNVSGCGITCSYSQYLYTSKNEATDSCHFGE
jgi:hypothetical protein